jgi:anaerobic selenocysteine-containing dehydrogenase
VVAVASTVTSAAASTATSTVASSRAGAQAAARGAAQVAVSGDTAVAYRTCPLCEATCGLEVHHRGREITLVRGDRDDVFSRGYLCPKGAALGRLEADPDRLRRPQLRDGGTWREISWEEAWAVLDARLRPVVEEHGPSSVGVYLGNPNVHNLAGQIFNRVLLRALGTHNVFSASTVDQMPKQVSSALMFGGGLTIPIPDVDRTDFLLMLGANPWESNGSLLTAPDLPGRLEALRARGGRLVVVDPRRTKTAERADEHVAIRPGTDAHLLWGVVHTLFADGLVELGGLAAHVEGLEVVERLAKDFPPDAVAPITGVDAATIRRLAHDLAAAPTAAVYGRIGTCVQEFGTQASWLVDVCNVLTGNLDRPGGALFTRAATSPAGRAPGPGRGARFGRWASRVRGEPERFGELPAVCLAEEIEAPGEGQIRALITVAGNPVLSTPDGDRLAAALGTLDFMVSVDPYCNETTSHAHLILPPEHGLARDHYDLAFSQLAVRNVANWTPAAVELEPGEVPEWETLLRLAACVAGTGAASDPAPLDDLAALAVLQAAAGREGNPVHGREPAELLALLAPRRGPARVVDAMLRTGHYGDGFGVRPGGLSLDLLEGSPHGVDLGPLEPRIPEVLRTASGRIELAPELLVDDVERLRATLDRDPEPERLLLVGRRDLRSNNSWMHNVEVLVKGKPRCTLHVHPDDAARLGLVHGGAAAVTSDTATVTIPVEVTDRVMRGVVSIPHGWGHDARGARLGVAARHPGVNTNRLASTAAIDPLSGNAALSGIPVRVAPGA